MSETAHKPIFRGDYRVPAYLVHHFDLDFQIYEGRTRVTSKIDFYKNPVSAGDSDLALDGENLTLVAISLNGVSLDRTAYVVDDHSLTLKNPPSLGTLSIVVDISPETNTTLEGLYVSDPIYCTQCESHGFRRITYFLDRPDVMTAYTVRVEADAGKCPVLLSNGNCVERGAASASRHYAIWNDPFKKPSYLFALVAGKLDHIHDTFVTASGRNVDLYIYTEYGFTGQCHWAMASLKNAMRWDEQHYGREYDLDLFNIVAVSSFNMGAMENKSLNIFNTSTVYASTETTSDGAFVRVESVVAHEYFHNWTGDRITCRDWFQLTLKEGLTVFRDQCFSGDMHSPVVQRIDDVETLRTAQFPEDAGPMAHPIRPESYIAMDNFYTATVYEKGAEVIRMMRTLLGDKLYRRATDLYFERFDGQAVTCDDFVQCMQDASDTDMSQFMLWYSQPGTPMVKARGEYDAAKCEYTLNLTQSFPTQADNKPVLIPVIAALFASDGTQMTLNERGDIETALRFNEREQKFVFTNIRRKPVHSLFRDFSAPVNFESGLDGDELRLLMRHDTDGFNRYEAANIIRKTFMVDRLNGRPVASDDIIDAIKEALCDTKIDDAFRTSMISIPFQGVLEQLFDRPDPVKIALEILKVQREIGIALKDDLLSVYHDRAARETSAGFPSAEEISARMLKNFTLEYLHRIGDETTLHLSIAQYKSAANMSDRITALSFLCDTDHPFREEALDDFYRRFSHDKLIIDKWFAVQAEAMRDDIFEKLEALQRHPAFDIKNPNRARSLYLAFVGSPLYFHEKGGRGYDFHSAAILTIDEFNPQIAARFMKPFQNWKKYVEPYSSLMRHRLERIASKSNLSPNLREIVGKYLA